MPGASSTREAKRTVSRLHRVKVQLPRSSTGRACILALGYSKNAEPTSAPRLPSPLLASTRLYPPLLASTRFYSPVFAASHAPPSAVRSRPLTRAPIHRSSSRRRSDRSFALVSLSFRPQPRIIQSRRSQTPSMLDASNREERERRRAVGRDSRSRSSKRAAGERRRTARREIYRGELSRGSVACSEKSRRARRRATAWRGPSRRRGTSLETGETYLLRAIFRSRVVKQQKIINHRDF